MCRTPHYRRLHTTISRAPCCCLCSRSLAQTWTNYFADATTYNWRTFDGEYSVHLCARDLNNYGMALPHADSDAVNCGMSYENKKSATGTGESERDRCTRTRTLSTRAR